MTVIFNFRNLVSGDYALNGATYTDHGDGSITFANSSGATIDILPYSENLLVNQIGVNYPKRNVVVTLSKVSSSGVILYYSPDGNNTTIDIDGVAYKYTQSRLMTMGLLQYNFLRITNGSSIRMSYWNIILVPSTKIPEYDTSTSTLTLVQRCDYTPLRIEVESSLLSSGSVVRLGAYLPGQNPIESTGAIVVEGDTKYAEFTLAAATDTNRRASGNWRWSMEYIDSSSKVHPLLIDKRMILEPSNYGT